MKYYNIGADGSTRVMTGPTSILPKTTQAGQSLIKIQPSGQAAVSGIIKLVDFQVNFNRCKYFKISITFKHFMVLLSKLIIH